jgi:ABC-type phosphate transport system substrate-binding protein
LLQRRKNATFLSFVGIIFPAGKISAMRWRTSLLLFLLSFPPSTVRANEILSYAGATTLQHDFMPEAAQLFHQETGISFRITGGNTDPGIKALLQEKVRIAGGGRFLRPEEKAAGLVGTLIGWDPIVIIVHRTNPIDNLTREQLGGIFSGRIRNWREVGGEDQPILVVSSPPGSGMRVTVQKEILKNEAYTAREIISLLVADDDRQVAGRSYGRFYLLRPGSARTGYPRTQVLQA